LTFAAGIVEAITILKVGKKNYEFNYLINIVTFFIAYGTEQHVNILIKN
jgi:hypothetical protein